MARPVKWSRDVHQIREGATQSRTETWSRQEIEYLFSIGRASAQSLMKAIGDIQTVGGTHFVQRTSLLSFLDEMIAADSVEGALRSRLDGAARPPAPKPLKIALPVDLRRTMIRDIPATIALSEGRLEISAKDTEDMLEKLALLAQALENDLPSAQAIWDPPKEPRQSEHDEIAILFAEMRRLQGTTS